MNALDQMNDRGLIQALVDETVRVTPLKGYDIDLVEHHLNEMLYRFHCEGFIVDYHSVRSTPTTIRLSVLTPHASGHCTIDIQVTKAPPQYAEMPSALASSLGL